MKIEVKFYQHTKREVKMATPEKEAKLQELWQEFLKQKPPNSDLLTVLIEIEPLRQMALEQLFRQGITRDEITCIMISVPDLGDVAQKLFDWRNKNTPIIQKILGQMRALAEETKKGQR